MSLFELVSCLEDILSNWPDVSLFLGASRRVQQYHSSSVHPQPLDGHILKDPQFLARLHLFSDVLHEIGYRFQGVLTGSRDAGFYVYGQVARFIHSLGLKCLKAESVPDSANWEALIGLDVAACAKIPVNDFGQGTEFRRQLLASKPHHLADLLEQARDFYLDLLTGFLSASRHVVAFSKGLAAFDPNLLYREDTELAHDCLSSLFEMFQQRGWFMHKEKPSLVMEYDSFMANLKLEHSDAAGRPLPVVDVISTFATMPSLCDKALLKRLFRLVCLCLPLKGLLPVPADLGLEANGLVPAMARCLVVPLYSCGRELGSSAPLHFDGDSISECEGLVAFGPSLYSAPDFCPWDHVEFTPRDEIFDRLTELHETVLSAPRKSKPSSVPASLVGVAGAPPTMPPESSGSAARTSLRKRGGRKKSSRK